MGDRRKCQTYTASPAEPGGLPVMLVCIRQFSRPAVRHRFKSRIGFEPVAFRLRVVCKLHGSARDLT